MVFGNILMCTFTAIGFQQNWLYANYFDGSVLDADMFGYFKAEKN